MRRLHRLVVRVAERLIERSITDRCAVETKPVTIPVVSYGDPASGMFGVMPTAGWAIVVDEHRLAVVIAPELVADRVAELLAQRGLADVPDDAASIAEGGS